MGRGRWFVLAILIAAIAVTAGLVRRSPRPSIDTSPSTFAKLRYGMTRDEVEAVFGGPPDDYSTDLYNPEARVVWGSWMCPAGEIPGVFRANSWITDDGWAMVAFNERGTVDYLEWRQVAPPRPWHVRNGPLVMFVAYTVLLVAAAAWLSRQSGSGPPPDDPSPPVA